MTLPLSHDQALRIRVIQFITHGPTQTTDVVKRYHIAPEDVDAYEAQLVTWGLISAQTIYPQPRYTMADAGWTYIGLSRLNGLALTVDAILAEIPISTFAGDDASVAAALVVLQASGLVQPNTGFTLTTV